MTQNILIGGKSYTPDEIAVLAKADVLSIGQKHDPASTTLTATPLHGAFHGNANQFGIFSAPGTRPGRYSALVRLQHIANVLSFLKTDVIQERLEIMTGVTDSSGENATGFCGNPPVGGQLKVCAQTFRFGEIHIKTNLGDLMQTGLRRNRADIPGEIYNLATTDNPLLPAVPELTAGGDTMSLLRSELLGMTVMLERSVADVDYVGTQGTQNNTYIGIQTQWTGIDGQVITGHTDADTGIACAAADSVVDSFNAEIDGAQATSGLDFVEAAHDTWYAVNQRARGVGMAGVQWVIAMRPEAFQRAVQTWACAYATYRCKDGSAGSPVNREGMEIQNLRLAMQGGQYLLFDATQVPVVLDEGIPQDVLGANHFKSDMYFIPVGWAGRPLTYVQYFDTGNPYATEFADFLGNDTRVINDGLYRVAQRTTGFCKEYLFGAKLRIILDAPFLAGRLDDIRYSFYAKIRSGDPGVTAFYADGGVTHRL
jgi:hypothetical protein